MGTAGELKKRSSNGSSGNHALVPTRNLNQSRVKSFIRCEQQYHFRYDYPILVMGKKKGELVASRPSVGLRRGSWMHKLMEAHFRGESWKKVHKGLTKEYS